MGVLNTRTSSPSNNLPAGYINFLQHTYNILSIGLDRELYRQYQTENRRQKMQLPKEKIYTRGVPAPSRLRTASSRNMSAHRKRSTSRQTIGNPVSDTSPPLWGDQSDEIGRSVLAILQKDPRKFELVARHVHGRQLPGSLRAYIWSDVLFKVERKRLQLVSVEKRVRERFAKAINRGLEELSIKRATQSPINGLIENAVVEIYDNTTCLIPHNSPEHMKEAIRTLNILYVYDRSYEPYLIYWLFPLQIAFQSQNTQLEDKGEKIVELAMYLDLLNSCCFPTWPSVFAIAEKVLADIKEYDPDFYNHLKTISRRNVQVNKKEFLVQLLNEEKMKADKLLQTNAQGSKEPESSEELLADPLVFIRRWIGEGFVSILDAPCVMYVWDQCFLQHWHSTVFVHFCIALLELMRYKFKEVHDYLGMREVFLNEACKLYTMDIQRAWKHLQDGNDLRDIPQFNRQAPGYSETEVSSPCTETDYTLHPVGLKHINIELIFPADVKQRELWVEHIDPTQFVLNVTAYFGDVTLQSYTSMKSCNVVSMTTDNYGNSVYQIGFPGDKFIYRDIDLQHYDVEREMGASPYVILTVGYRDSNTEHQSDAKTVTVGWARIPLFQRAHGNKSVSSHTSHTGMWELLVGERTYDLHPGEISSPQSVSPQPVTPQRGKPGHGDAQQEGAILGYNSNVTVLIFDPERELLTPSPEPRVDSPWVPHNVETTALDPKPTGLKDTIDLYIDSVRFIPDNASIVKVTGRVLRTGSVGNIEDFLALPDLDGSARCPAFTYRLTINKRKKEADPGMLVFLRVYTVDIVTDTIAVIGSCLVPLFDNKKKLRVGGFQYKLHNGMPVLTQPAGLSGIKPTDLDTVPTMPGTTVLVRIRPHTKEFTPSQPYHTGYYQSAACKPNQSEYRIFRSYSDHLSYPATVRDMILRIMEADGDPTSNGNTDTELLYWLQGRLDVKRNQTPSRPAGNLSMVTCVRYRLKMGLKIQINQVFGMPEGLYMQCLARVAPGDKVLNMKPTPEGYGSKEKFVTVKHNFDSYQSAQKWNDPPSTLHPFYDQYSCLIIQLFGLEVQYHPTADHTQPGEVTNTRGQQLSLNAEDYVIGWTVLPLFGGNAVLVGNHNIPVFKGKPSTELLQQLTRAPCELVLPQQNWTSRNKYISGSLNVTLWDAHFAYADVPELPEYEYLLKAVGNLSDYQQAYGTDAGKTMTDFILDGLAQDGTTEDVEPGTNTRGVDTEVLKTECDYFQQVMEHKFNELFKKYM